MTLASLRTTGNPDICQSFKPFHKPCNDMGKKNKQTANLTEDTTDLLKISRIKSLSLIRLQRGTLASSISQEPNPQRPRESCWIKIIKSATLVTARLVQVTDLTVVDGRCRSIQHHRYFRHMLSRLVMLVVVV